MDGGNRIGTVSSVDADTGMVSVMYQDRDGEVTQLLPYATFNDEYKLPKVGTKVVVIHLSNGSEMGIVLGTYWNRGNPAGNPGSYLKKIGEKAYFMYQDGLLTIEAERVCISSAQSRKSFEAGELVKQIEAMEKRLEGIDSRLSRVEQRG